MPKLGFSVLAAVGGRAIRSSGKAATKALEKLRGGLTDASRFTVMFLLLKRVVTQPHPFWPDVDEAIARAIRVVQNFLARQEGGAANG